MANPMHDGDYFWKLIKKAQLILHLKAKNVIVIALYLIRYI